MQTPRHRIRLASVLLLFTASKALQGQSTERIAIAAPEAGASLIVEVVDAVSGQPLPSAQVSLRGSGLRCSTGINGRCVLRAATARPDVLEIRRLGYLPVVLQDVSLSTERGRMRRIPMTAAPFRLSAMTVTPGSFAFADAPSSVPQTMTRREIESAPFGEDLFRAMNRLPGLSSGDYGAQFSIRGGRADETLIMFDGLEIFEPFHLKDFNEGALSIFNVEAIDGVELLTGGFSAQYGDKRSGVMNITSRTPTRDRPGVTAGVSLTGAQLLGEGRFGGGRGSWLLSGRSGFAGLVMGLIGKKETRAPSYQDAFGTVRFAAHPNHTVSLSVLHAADRYRFDIKGTTGFNDTIRTQESADNRYGNSYGWVTLRSLLGPHVAVRTIASIGAVTADRGGDEHRVDSPVTLYEVRGNRDFTILGLKQDFTFQRSARLLVDWGFDMRALNARYNWLNSVTQNPDNPTPDTTGFYPRVTRRARRADGKTAGAYISNRIRIIDPLTIEAGLRYDRASYTGDRDWSPRLHAMYRIADRTTLRAGWGHYRQRQGIADENAFTGANRFFTSELSRQWSAGVEHQFASGGSVRIEGYHKTGSRLRPILRNWKSGLNVFPESSEDRMLVYPDSSTSKGAEVYLQRAIGNRLNVRSGYAFAFADEHVARIDHVNDPLKPPFAKAHPNPQDQRHALNLDLTYRMSGSWSLVSALTLHSGWPYTNEIGVPIVRRNGTRDLAVRPDSLYGARLPLYQRLDLRVTRRRVTARGDFRFFAEIINLTNHENVLGYDIFRVRDAAGAFQLVRNAETWFSILPSAGVTWTRRF